jgi:hypothetical protein
MLAVRSEIVMLVTVKITVFWEDTPSLGRYAPRFQDRGSRFL